MPFLTAELIFYAVVSGLGLLTAVYAMLNGSALNKHTPSQLKAPPAAFNTPVAGTAALAFGIVGYAFSKYGHFGPTVNFIAALVACGASWIGMTVLMANWAYKGSLVDPHEELEELQGTVASVTRPITNTSLGEVEYFSHGQRLHAQARSIDGTPVDVGTDVVIEKIVDGVADVELWSVVEQRI
jgi:hypothetical protein